MSLSKKTFVLITISIILSSSITFFICNNYFKAQKAASNPTASLAQQAYAFNCDYLVHRSNDYQYIKPIQYIETECESNKFLNLKSQVQNLISYNSTVGNLISASVYLRDFDKNEWMNVNATQGFHPGSLMKLALLITFLKHDEKNPGFLNTKVSYTTKLKVMPHQTYNSKQIEFGKSYTIKELLRYMISYSDNSATLLLHTKADVEEYKKTFERIGLSVPNVTDRNYSITSKEYAIFFKILYNAGYVSPEHSELAMELLAKCDFEKGMVAGFPPGTPIAHKFGEWGDGKNELELHESGIIYFKDKAYLLVVMTKGKDVQKLIEVISTISKLVSTNLS